MPRPFDPKTDTPVLRECLKTLAAVEKLTPYRLMKLLNRYPDKRALDGPISRTSLYNFIEGAADAPFKRIDQLRDIWNALSAHPDYAVYLPAKPEPGASFGGELSSGDALSLALQRFFHEEDNVSHSYPFETMRKRLPGRYLMYRPDWRGVANRAPYENTVTVSQVDIAATEHGLAIRETQDFPQSPYGEIDQVNSGVFFPYGRYLIAVMNANKGASFKCVVLNHFEPFAGTRGFAILAGKMLVASDEGLFPSQNVFCQRVTTKTYRVGILKLTEVKNDAARRHITQPTFNVAGIIS